ncbi:MAG TPA: RDD family protein [Steroidobacteraceae bacterium]|nr:RDD family protein [Steroidobacteraceae bacterium]
MSTPTPNTQNPYAPPAARVEDVAEASGPGELAGRGTRFGAILLDALILGVAEGPAIFGGIKALAAGGAAGGAAAMTDRMAILSAMYLHNPYMPITGVLFCIWAIITIVFVARNGQSIGKRICGIKVVRTDGSKASFWRIFLLRNLVNGIPSLIPIVSTIYFLVDSLMIFSESRQCLHDKIASTLVVKA